MSSKKEENNQPEKISASDSNTPNADEQDLQRVTLPTDFSRFAGVDQTRTVVVNCCGKSEPQPEPEPQEKEPCCCCFEVHMSRVRVLFNKDGKAEIIIAGYANEFTAVHPSLGSWMVVSDDWGWVNIARKVGLFTVPKGTTLPVSLRADAIEVDGAFGGSWELGSSEESSEISLSCSISRSIRSRVQVATHRDKLGGGETARIEIEFEAFKVPCPSPCGCA